MLPRGWVSGRMLLAVLACVLVVPAFGYDTFCSQPGYYLQVYYASSNYFCNKCTVCGPGSYVYFQCPSGASTQDTVCAVCSPNTCFAGTYLSSRCTATADRVCSGCSVCSLGKYASSACTTSADTVCSTCSACPAGKYQTGVCTSTTDTVCTGCGSCGAGTYQVGACTVSSNTRCATCGTCGDGFYAGTACQAGGVVTQNTVCRACGTCLAGSYMSGCGGASAGRCTNCTVCQPGQFVSSNCQGRGPRSDRVCSACVAPRTSVSVNAASCNVCVAGYVLDSGTGRCLFCGNYTAKVMECAQLSSYISCPGGAANKVECKPCTGSGVMTQAFCPAGMQASKSCSVVRGDGGNAQDAVCQACPTGWYNPLGQQLFCAVCPAGMYTDGPGSTACLTCTNANGIADSGYLPWASAGANACPWGCNSGFYVSGGGCQPCWTLARPNARTVYVPWPNVTALGVCQAVCDVGFGFNGSWGGAGLPVCGNCAPGFYKDWAGNDACRACGNAGGVANSVYIAGSNGYQASADCPW